MRRLNIAAFFDEYRDQFGSVPAKIVAPLERFLGYLVADPYVTRLEDAAYMTATADHETAHTFRPIRELGGAKRAERMYGYLTSLGRRLGNDAPGEGAAYDGKGFVQVTGENNYEWAERTRREKYPDVVKRFELRTGKPFDLTVGDQEGDEDDPLGAMDEEIAYCILSEGMRTGAFGQPVGRFTHKTPPDFAGARKSVNGTDRAKEIAERARKFLACFEAATRDEESDTVPPPPDAPQAQPAPAIAPAADPAPLVGQAGNVTIQDQNVAPPTPVPGGAPTDDAVKANKDSLITKIMFWAKRAFGVGAAVSGGVGTATAGVTAVGTLSERAQLIVVWVAVGLIALVIVVSVVVFIVAVAVAAVDHWQSKDLKSRVDRANVV